MSATDGWGQVWTLMRRDGRYCIFVASMTSHSMVQLPGQPPWFDTAEEAGRVLIEHAQKQGMTIRGEDG